MPPWKVVRRLGVSPDTTPDREMIFESAGPAHPSGGRLSVGDADKKVVERTPGDGTPPFENSPPKPTAMTISTRIRGELFAVNDPQNAETVETVASPQLIRLPLTRPPNGLSKRSKKKKPKKVSPVKVEAAVADQLASHRHGLPWTIEEHDRFLQGLEQYPCGPWKAVAAFVGTRTPRQTMTHAQKYRQKIQRRRRGLMTSSRQPVPVSSDVYGGLVITTTQETCAPTTGVDTSKSPTAVDTVPSATGLMENHPLCPLESNWFESVAVEELDAAFRAFLEGYDPSQLSLDDQQHEFDAFKEENVISL